MKDLLAITLRPVSAGHLLDEKFYIDLHHSDFNRAVREAKRIAKRLFLSAPLSREVDDFEVVSIYVI